MNSMENSCEESTTPPGESASNLDIKNHGDERFTTFTRFPDLLLELQRKIWEYTFTPRLMIVQQLSTMETRLCARYGALDYRSRRSHFSCHLEAIRKPVTPLSLVVKLTLYSRNNNELLSRNLTLASFIPTVYQ